MTEQTEPDPDITDTESEDSVNTINSEDLESDEDMELSKYPHRSGHLTQESSHLTQKSNHLTEEPHHLTEESSHITQESSHLTRESSHLTRESSHLTRESSHLTRASSHLTQDPNHFTQGPSNLTQEPENLTKETKSSDLPQESEQEAGENVDKDVMNMFASVWVKVEVEEEDSNIVPDDLTDVNYEPPGARKTGQKGKKSGKKNRSRPTKILSCEQCDYTTVYHTGLVVHMIGHSTEKPHVCPECGYKSKYRNALTRHIKIQHQKDDTPPADCAETFSCDECDYKTHFKWNLRAHKRKHNMDKQFQCEHCDYKTAYRHNYMKHNRTHQNNDKMPTFYKCDKCTFATKFEGHIARHLAKIHNEVTDTAYKCEMCDFSTRVRWRLNIHKTRSRQPNILMCAYCEFQTYFMCESKKHKVLHYDVMYGHKANVKENDAAESYQSEESHNSQIDAITGLPSVMEQSKEEHQNDYINSYMDIDHNGKNQKKYLIDPNCVDWNSIQVLESDDKDRPFQCHMCTYTSRFKASVQRHFQRHHTGSQNRPYKCMNCDFSTKTKDQIALHNKRSKSECTLFCAVCKYTTMYKCQYVMHQKRHYEHKCSQCEYCCKHKYELQKHYMTIHMGNGHKCQYCDYVAARKESLLCHETIHTGIKPFKCSHCEYMSVRRSLLNNHVRRYHSNMSPGIVVVSDSKIASLKHEGSIDGVNQQNVDFS